MKLFDVQTTAAFLGISRQSVDRLIGDGALQAIPVRTGKRKKIVRISDVSLKKFLGLPPGQQLVIEPALIHKAEKKKKENSPKPALGANKEKSSSLVELAIVDGGAQQ